MLSQASLHIWTLSDTGHVFPVIPGADPMACDSPGVTGLKSVWHSQGEESTDPKALLLVARN